jgi:hypothetical protein
MSDVYESDGVHEPSKAIRALNAKLSALGRCPVCHLLEPHVCIERREPWSGPSPGAQLLEESPDEFDVVELVRDIKAAYKRRER